MEQSPETQFALIEQRLGSIEITLQTFITRTDDVFVTKDQFTPVKNIVYGVAASVGLSLVAAIAALVIKR